MVKPRLPPSLQATEAECNGPGVAVIELSGEESSAPAEPTLRSLGLPQPDFHAVILDFSSLNFVDTVSIKIVKNVRGQGVPSAGAGQLDGSRPVPFS